MLKNATILVVDDEPGVLRLLRAVLERDGYTVLTASGVATAKQTALARRVGLILSDIDLPDGTGLEFCLWVKAQPDLAHVPVLLCSVEMTRRRAAWPWKPEPSISWPNPLLSRSSESASVFTCWLPLKVNSPPILNSRQTKRHEPHYRTLRPREAEGEDKPDPP